MHNIKIAPQNCVFFLFNVVIAADMIYKLLATWMRFVKILIKDKELLYLFHI